jgi:hypothetical protein
MVAEFGKLFSPDWMALFWKADQEITNRAQVKKFKRIV